ncbi:hypothetical protein [Pectobacterium versatile]|uniref:hypothetical protein n=1 Tax=Pectobacterium versatile TaxID=2488639 RepID=UPI000D3F6877|nr:hypothetical protein [Pectobacterium versatile]MBQ4794506.1 hypothetical protein [Pectobacterium versatile]POY59950.1 hypothetical protein PB70LOC_00432 [Pectobacterium versatile]POY64578.1 hypothetical protein PB69LOC_00843 [Pectobacterium versatile]
MPRLQSGCYIPFPDESYKVNAVNRRGKPFDMDAKALYLTWGHGKIFMNYAGEKSAESYSTIEMPRDPDFLRLIAKKINELADLI